jgi:peptidyl-prolyl cis-trans isomerase D
MAVIGTIRNKMGGVLIVVIALAMIAFILMDFGGKGNGPSGSNNIAEVNGESISYAEFDERLKANESYMQNQMQGAEMSDMQKEGIRNSTFDELLTEKLKAGVYADLGISLGEAEKAALLFEDGFRHPSITSSFQGENGQFSLENFKTYLSTLDVPDPNSNLTSEEKRAQWMNFEKAIYKERLDKKYNTLLTKSTNVPTWMANALYKNENTNLSVEYVYLPFSSIPDDQVKITDEELKAYIEKNSKKYQQEASVNIKFLSFKVAPSKEDINEINSWMSEKFAAWKTVESDSLFIMGNSETKWDKKFYKKSELMNPFVDSIFAAPVGSYFGPQNNGGQLAAYKIIDKRAIPDSVQVRHLLITGEGYQSQDEVLALIDSLKKVIIEEKVPLASLTSQFSQDPSNAQNGGDLSWARPGQMVPTFNDAIFYEMKVGDVKLVYTEFGAHFVEVYGWGTTTSSVKLATLNRSILTSEATNSAIYAEASTFATKNNTKELFLASSDKIMDGKALSKKTSTIPGLNGNAREAIKWAFNAELGEVSTPFFVGDNFVVVLQDGTFEEGTADLENVRALVEVEVRKEKKAEMLSEKVSGSDLSAIASSNKVSVQKADLSLLNSAISGIGNEPKVAGTALGLAENSVSKPVVGENGVFVVKTIKKIEAPAASDLSSYKSKASMYGNLIQSKIYTALKKAAKIVDNSFDFF